LIRRLVVSTLICSTLQVSAQEVGAPAYGFGSAKCSAFLGDVQRRGEMAEAIYFSWAQGFITAVNAVSGNRGMIRNFTSKVTRVEQQALLKTFCQKNPDQSFSSAVFALVDHLRAAEGLKPLLSQ
jgi:hypothetical protein